MVSTQEPNFPIAVWMNTQTPCSQGLPSFTSIEPKQAE